MTKKSLSGFTLVEMLVVIAIIATIAAFAVPALTSALTKGQMTGTMNNARQLYLAAYQMALDGTTNSDATLGWPGDLIANKPTMTLEDYCSSLVNGGYLQAGDLTKLLSASGTAWTATGTTANNVTTVTLTGKSSLKIYPVTGADPGNFVFSATSNYVYDTALTAAGAPYSNKGFVVMRKGGDGVVLRQSNAVAPGTAPGISAFEATVGKKDGDADGTVTAGDPTGYLHFP